MWAKKQEYPAGPVCVCESVCVEKCREGGGEALNGLCARSRTAAAVLDHLSNLCTDFKAQDEVKYWDKPHERPWKQVWVQTEWFRPWTGCFLPDLLSFSSSSQREQSVNNMSDHGQPAHFTTKKTQTRTEPTKRGLIRAPTSCSRVPQPLQACPFRVFLYFCCRSQNVQKMKRLSTAQFLRPGR